MKNTKSIISLLLCIALCFGLCCYAFAATKPSIALSLDEDEITEGTATTITMYVGTSEDTVPVAISGEAYAANKNITISAINDGYKELSSTSTATGRFAWMNSGNKKAFSDWAEVVFSIPATLPAGEYTLGVTDMSAQDSTQAELLGESSKTITFTVKAATVAVTSVSIAEEAIELTVGGNQTLNVTVNPSNATDKTVTWTSSKESVATVDATGKVVAVAAGTTTITALCGGKSDTCTVTVKAATVAVTSVSIAEESIELTAGENKTLNVTVNPSNATDKTVTWTSSKENVATVDATGKVVAVAAGTTTITAICGGKSDTCTVTVKAATVPVTSVNIPDAAIELTVGGNKTLTATVEPSNASVKTVTWSSDTKNVATVDANGKVTAVGVGTAIITATSGDKSDTCTVTVKPVAVTGVEIGTSAVTIYVGSVKYLYATVAPSNATNKSVTWNSDAENVATVDASGKVTAVAVGTAVITVTTADGQKTATCTVTVKERTYSDDETYTKPVEEKEKTVTVADCPKDDTCPMAKFTDVNMNMWYHDGVHYCVENGIMKGMTEKTFAPYGTASRAMIVTMIWRLEGSPVVNYAMTYEDVPANEWYTEAVRWATAEKIVNGYDAKHFGPNNAVTREQLATILYNYAKTKDEGFTGAWMFLLDFTDANKVSSWANEAMHWCTMNKIINGRGNKILDPKAVANRAETAAMFQRFCEAINK